MISLFVTIPIYKEAQFILSVCDHKSSLRFHVIKISRP
uniref:Uncharacterized protein n=1 Tax=Rhizophora mucronata TaxID=61149 RepID=A0A2P2R0P8_RHIMU